MPACTVVKFQSWPYLEVVKTFPLSSTKSNYWKLYDKTQTNKTKNPTLRFSHFWVSRERANVKVFRPNGPHGNQQSKFIRFVQNGLKIFL